MKILHITASYKPAYIYGGPIMSVAKLCEGLAEREGHRAESGKQGVRSKEQGLDSLKLKAESSKLKVESQKSNVKSRKFDLEVLTTTANGKSELDFEVGEPVIVDGVPVTYFKRWTKDHSHFSPGLLLALYKSIHKIKTPPSGPFEGGQKSNNLTTYPSMEEGIYQNLQPAYQIAKINSSERRQKTPRLPAPPTKGGNEIVIHIHAWWNLVSVLSCFMAKWYKIPVVLSPRGMLTLYSQNNSSSFSKKIMQWFIGDRLLRYCHVHVTSEQEKQDVLQIVHPKSVTVIPNLVRIEEEKSKEKRERNEDQGEKCLDARNLKVRAQSIDHILTFKLLFLSRIEEKKGLELLFDALASLDFDYQLTIAGSGEDDYVKSLKRKAKSLKLEDRITWIGQIRHDEKFSIMTAHDLLVLPSYNENFANVVIESLSVGTPVLVSENVGLADYVQANDLGWICSLEPKDIAEKITDAYTDVAKREKISSNAPALIKNDYNDEVLVGRYLELYEEILGFNSEN